jgi:hypothetical protein
MTLGIVQQLRDAAGKLRPYSARKGWAATLLAIARAPVQRMVRYRHHFIWETLLDASRTPSAWAEEEQFSIIGPDTLDREMNPRRNRFLGAAADDDLKGVREGDRLLLVEIESACVYSGYIYFDTTVETRRQKRIYCEPGDAPVIGTCSSTPVKIWTKSIGRFPADSELTRKIRHLLPPDITVESAAAGFRNLGQFVYTAQLAHNLRIPFDQLKTRVTGGDTLWKAIEELKSGVDTMAEVRRAWDEASIHRRVLNDVFLYLRQLGYKRAINEVLADNLPSLNANQAVGMRICRELRTWTIFGRVAVQRIAEAGRSRWRVIQA